MRGLILGDSPLNASAEAFFTARGHTMRTLGDVFALRELRGEAGAFTAALQTGEETADFVLFTQPPNPAPPQFGGVAAQSLYTEDKVSLCAALAPRQAVAFLLDYDEEATSWANWYALTSAEALARKKYQVYFFARYIRTAERGCEELYLRAREAGAVFMHYEQLVVQHRPKSGGFTLLGNDGVLETRLEAALLFADGGRRTGEAYDHCRAALRLWPQSPGRLPKDVYFLPAVCTSRKGVFQLGPSFFEERLSDGLRYIAAALPTAEMAATQGETANIMGERCALCLTCYRACPHAALQPAGDKRQMECLQSACQGCGNCVPLCPGNAIRLGAKPLPKEESAPPPEAKNGALLCLCCENSAALAMKTVLAGLSEADAAQISLRCLPCGGSLGLEEISQGLLQYQKVLVATCIEGACRHFEGSSRAKRQCARLADMLAALGLAQNRVRHLQSSHAMPLLLKQQLLAFLHEDASNHTALEVQP